MPSPPEFRAEVVRLARGITASMSRVGDCDDNAPAERCYAALKAELVATNALADPRRRAAGRLRVARSLVQPSAPPRRPRVP